MGIKTTIHGTKEGNSADVQEAGFLSAAPGLVVYTEPRQRPVSRVRPFTNSTYGGDFNQNAGFGGTPAGIHNGTDSVLWTSSVVGGPTSKFDFASTTQAYAGTKSVDGSASTNGVSAVFTAGSPITVSSYVAFTMYIYLTSWDQSDTTRNITIEPRLSGVSVGSSVNVAAKINTASLNTWQKVVIPFSEFLFSSATFDSIYMTTVAPAGTPPDYFVDNLQLEQTGSPLSYTVEPTSGKMFAITGYNIFIADVLDTTLASNSMPKLAYDKLLGTTLSSGISMIIREKGVERSGGVFYGLVDFLSKLGRSTITSGSDGTNAWVSVHVDVDSVDLDSMNKDSITLTISDDLSGLLRFDIVALGQEYIIGT